METPEAINPSAFVDNEELEIKVHEPEVNPDQTISSELAKYNITEAILGTLPSLKELTINGLDDAEGYRQVHQARMFCKKLRVQTEKVCQAYRKPLLDMQRAWVAKEKDIAARIADVEKDLLQKQEAIDTEKEAIKVEKIRQQKELVRNRLELLARYRQTADWDELVNMPEVDFQMLLAGVKGTYEAEEAAKEAERLKVEELVRLEKEKLEAERLEREAEAAKKEKEAQESAALQKAMYEAQLEAEREKARKEKEEREAILHQESQARLLERQKQEAELAELRKKSEIAENLLRQSWIERGLALFAAFTESHPGNHDLIHGVIALPDKQRLYLNVDAQLWIGQRWATGEVWSIVGGDEFLADLQSEEFHLNCVSRIEDAPPPPESRKQILERNLDVARFVASQIEYRSEDLYNISKEDKRLQDLIVDIIHDCTDRLDQCIFEYEQSITKNLETPEGEIPG